MNNLTPEERKALIAERIVKTTGYAPEVVAAALSEEPQPDAPYPEEE